MGVVKHFAEPGRLESEWKRISDQVKVDKVYIEAAAQPARWRPTRQLRDR